MTINDANIIKELKDLAKQAPKSGYVHSSNGDVIRIKAYYNASDYYLVEVLENLLKNGQIRELHVNYDRQTGHLRSYEFR